MVYFLAGTVAEGIKNSFDGDAILLGCLSKEDQVKRCVNEGPSLEVFTPVQFPRAISEFMRSARYSMHRMKMYGERGSPWRMPLKGRKGSSFSPFIRTEGLGELMHDMIRSIHAFGKLNQMRKQWMKLHSKSIESFLKVDLKRHEATLASGDCHGMHNVHILVNEITKIESYNATSSSQFLLLLIWSFSIWTK